MLTNICIDLNMKVSMNNKEMPCNWLLVGETYFCKNPTREQYCASHAFKIQKGVIISQPCKGCGWVLNRAFSSVSHMVKVRKEHIYTINGSMQKKICLDQAKDVWS
jgi:hypothetical protein